MTEADRLRKREQDLCEVPRCRQRAEITYMGSGVCGRCFGRYTGPELRRHLGIPEEAA